MKKPLIVITPQEKPMEKPLDMARYIYTVNFNADRIVKRGGIPIIPPFLSEDDAEKLMERCDGLFMTGGADVDPSCYGEEKQPYCAETEPDRDASDLALMKAAMKLKKPIICFCRGSQMANVYFGGTLYQDLKTQLSDEIKHPDLANFRNETSHSINVVKGTPLYEMFGQDSFGVNSTHHQGVKVPGKGVKVMAIAPDGLVESWYYDEDGRRVRAYQWHPELQDDNEHNMVIIKDFVDACRK